MKRSVVLVAASLVALDVVGQPARAQDPAPGNAANGQRVFLADDGFTCHGRVGEGGNYYGVTPRLAKAATITAWPRGWRRRSRRSKASGRSCAIQHA